MAELEHNIRIARKHNLYYNVSTDRCIGKTQYALLHYYFREDLGICGIKNDVKLITAIALLSPSETEIKDKEQHVVWNGASIFISDNPSDYVNEMHFGLKEFTDADLYDELWSDDYIFP